MRAARVWLVLACCWGMLGAFGQTVALPEVADSCLRDGHLLFSVSPRGNAITQATVAAGDLPIDHVGMMMLCGRQACVVEAAPARGVAVTPLDDFLKANPRCVVGRVAGLDVSASLAAARDFVGLPYDSLFEADDRAMYCSELMQKCCVDSLGNPVFGIIPMSFHDSSGRTLPYWTEFYRRNGREVPEGEPGTNPGQLARSPRVAILGWLRHGVAR